MGSEPKELHFEGPFSFLPSMDHTKFIPDKLPEKSGIYLWTVELQQGYLVNYVGSTSSFSERVSQHLDKFLAGRYWVYDSVLFSSGIKFLEPPSAYKPQYQIGRA